MYYFVRPDGRDKKRYVTTTFTFVEMVVTRAAESTRSLVEDDNWGVVGDVAMMIIEELLCSLKWQDNLSKFLLQTIIS